MSKVRAMYQQFWLGLQLRERRTILLGAALVIITAIYLLLDSIWNTRAMLIADRTALLEESLWMQEQAELAEVLGTSCRENQILALENRELLELLASRNQLNMTSFSEAENTANAGRNIYNLRLEGASGDSILSFLFHSACQGFTLASLQIDKTTGVEQYTGQLELSNES